MKNTIFAIIIASFFIFSCSKPNYEFNETEMKTIGGELILLQERKDVLCNSEFGIGFVLSPKMLEMAQNGSLEIFQVSENQLEFIMYSSGIFDLLSALDPTEITEQQIQEFTMAMIQYSFQAAAIVKSPIEIEEDEVLSQYENIFSTRENIAKTDLWNFYLLYNTDFSAVSITENEIENFQKAIIELEEFKNNIFVFNPVLPQ